MARKPKRERYPFEVGDVVDFDEVRAAANPPEEPPAATREPETWPKGKRKPKIQRKRERTDKQQNYTLDPLTQIEETLRTEAFFNIAKHFELPAGKRGPEREYSDLRVALWKP